MKKAVIFLGGIALGFFIGYSVGKKKAYDESEEIISDLRKKNREEVRKLNNRDSDKTIVRKFRSLEEDDKLKEILGKKTSVLTEEEYDYLRSKGWDYEVVEYHLEKDEFTHENGTKFTLFETEGIIEEVTDAVIHASYDVGAFACIKNSNEKKVYEIVKIEEDGFDNDPFIIFNTEGEMMGESNNNTETREIYYDVDTNSYFNDPDHREETEDPFDGTETFMDDGVYYVKDEVKNINYILTVDGADSFDSIGTNAGDPEEVFLPPEFITEEEYSESNLGYDKKEVHYYMDRDEFVDEDNFKIDFPSKVFPKFSPREGAEYYVRNYENETDYYIFVIPSENNE